MFRDRLDLPLVEDATGRFMVWIMAVMVYLGIMALAGALVLAGMAERWENGLTGRLTVQISPQPDDLGRGIDTESVAPLVQRTEVALALLRATPGVLRAEAITLAAAHKLLEPWLGSALPDDLPLPALIDVDVGQNTQLEVPALADRLARSVPGARLDNHAAWLDDLRRLARTAQLVALAVVLLVGAAALAAVVFAVRTGLAIHSPVVELLNEPANWLLPPRSRVPPLTWRGWLTARVWLPAPSARVPAKMAVCPVCVLAAFKVSVPGPVLIMLVPPTTALIVKFWFVVIWPEPDRFSVSVAIAPLIV